MPHHLGAATLYILVGISGFSLLQPKCLQRLNMTTMDDHHADDDDNYGDEEEEDEFDDEGDGGGDGEDDGERTMRSFCRKDRNARV